MLGLASCSFRRRALAPALAARRGRGLASSRGGGGGGNPWLSDKSLYPLLGVTAATLVFAAWFGPTYLHRSPDVQTPMRRRTTQGMVQQKAHEGIPISQGMYQAAESATKGIYRVTIKDGGGAAKEGGEKK